MNLIADENQLIAIMSTGDVIKIILKEEKRIIVQFKYDSRINKINHFFQVIGNLKAMCLL
jgi:hypothetical protein